MKNPIEHNYQKPTCPKNYHLSASQSASPLSAEPGEGTACKGFGWVTFSTPEEAEAELLTAELRCSRRVVDSPPEDHNGTPRPLGWKMIEATGQFSGSVIVWGGGW